MPLLWLSLAFLAGAVLGEWLGWPLTAWLGLGAGALAVLLARPLLQRLPAPRFPLTLAASFFTLQVSHLPHPPVPYALLLLVLAGGAARYQMALPRATPESLAWHNDRGGEVIVEGVVAERPEEGEGGTRIKLRAERLRLAEGGEAVPARGLLMAETQTGGDEWRYGDRLEMRGRLETPPAAEEGFSYREYLRRLGVLSQMRYAQVEIVARGQGQPLLQATDTLRRKALEAVFQIFPDPEASLLAGILLGVDEAIPPRVAEAFQATGTAHIIAISGFNMTIISGLLAGLFGRALGKRKGAVGAALGIAAYTALVGAGASVVRAAIMGGLSLFARQVGRQQDGLNSLAFTAAVMTLVNPQSPWDVGFQLSFMATLGLVLYAGPLQAAFARAAQRRLPLATAQRLAGPVGEYFLFTLAAQITTLPVTVYHFQRLSPVSLVANPAVLPAQPAVMILGGIATMVGMVSLPIGRAAAWLAWPFTAYTIRAVELFARAPAANLALGEVSLPLVLAFYAALFGLTLGREKLRGWAPALAPGAAALSLGALAMLAWRAGLSAPDGRLHLTLLDTGGKGEAVLVQSPTGRWLLAGGGGNPSQLADGLGRRLPPGQHRLDWLAATGGSEAMEQVTERFPPENALWAGGGSAAADRLKRSLAAQETAITVAEAGQTLDLGGGARLEVVVLGEQGAGLLMEWRSFRALLPLGLDEEGLAALRDQKGPVTALLLANGVNAASNLAEWMPALRPQVLLASTEAGWQLDAETMRVLGGMQVLSTGEHGWIKITTDGERMWVDAERK